MNLNNEAYKEGYKYQVWIAKYAEPELPPHKRNNRDS